MAGACATTITFMVVATRASFAYENNISSQLRTASACRDQRIASTCAFDRMRGRSSFLTIIRRESLHFPDLRVADVLKRVLGGTRLAR